MSSSRMAMALVAGLLLSPAAGVSPAAAAVDPLVPPEVLAPADGAASAAGTAPTFRVRTGEGDDLLWVRFSASPSPVGTCGTIDNDIGSIGLEPSAGDLRLKGKTVEILLDGRPVGAAVVGSNGAFAATVRAPSRARRGSARYQARVGATRSQNLKLERRMVAAELARSGDTFTLTGQVTRPFARRPALISVQRYSSCRRKESVTVRTVRPGKTGRFRVSFRGPAGSANALMYRASTKVASRTGGAATKATYTLPRAINLK